jgi:hypothetical protein
MDVTIGIIPVFLKILILRIGCRFTVTLVTTGFTGPSFTIIAIGKQ